MMNNSSNHISSKSLLRLSTLLLVVFVFTGLAGYGQQFTMTNGTVTACEGTFLDDDDGEDGAYSVDGNYVFTICPDTPGDVVSVIFHAFSLFVSPNPQNSDYLEIFDGDNENAPTLGFYTGTSLQGLPATGTVNNATGCLTFVFNPNPNGNVNFLYPGWEAEISCTTPCDNPTASSSILAPAPLPGQQNSVGVCIDEPVTFQDNGSHAAPGFNIQYWIWNFNDGTKDTLTSAANVTHSFQEPGEYLVSLTVVDNNGCRSMNLEPFQVLVSTIPIFNTVFESPVCIGSDETTIDGSAVQSVTWTSLPPQVVAGTMYLPDGVGFAYESSLNFDFFEEGATLENCEDFLALTMNMEHSYLGDFNVTITCPNGTEVLLLPYPNGGNGVYLGEALSGSAPDPGVGWDYGWSPMATNGTLDDPANRDTYTYVNTAGNTVTHLIVNPGIYESEEDMCQLVGCPLNGEWVFTITDLWALDNGFLFEWGIDFNPELFPDITTFTPIVGLGPDSTWWEGPNINSTSADGNTIQTSYSTPGFYDYTFFASNNFGCTFDTLMTVEVIEGPDITAGPDLTYCDDPVTLQAGLTNNGQCAQASGEYTYCYGNNADMVVTYCPDNPGDGITYMEMIINAGRVENNYDQFYVYDGDDITAPQLGDSPYTGVLTGLTFGASPANPTGCITFRITSDNSVSCESSTNYEELEITVLCGMGLGLVWEWTPATGLSDPNTQNPTAEVNQATTYTVSAYPVGFPGCVITDQVTVHPDELADPGLDTDTLMCYNSPISYLTDYLEGHPALGGVWTNNATGEVVPDQFNPSSYIDGASFSFTYTITNGTCEGTSQLSITILPVTDMSCCQTNAKAGDDAVPCGLSYQLQAEQTVGIGTWTAGPDVVFSDIHDPHATVTCTTPGGGARTLTWTDDNGYLCKVSDEIVVHFADPLDILIITEDAICFDECSGKAIGIADGGTTTGGNYIYDWYENGKPGLVPATRDSLCAGTYMVKIMDDLACADSTVFEIAQPKAQEIFVTTNPPLCADSCSGQVNIISEGAVSYSYDGGETYVSDSRALVCAGEYEVLARNQKGCTISQEVRLIDPPKFVANFNINPLPTTIKNTTITFQDVSTPGPLMKSHFTFGKYPEILGVEESRISSFKFPGDTAGVYPVTLISTNVNGCIDTLTKSVVIKDDLLWYIPNSFSPNEDGINDIWKPVGSTIDVKDYKLTIIDRWGTVVFTTTDINEGWNGSRKGDGYYVDAGVYTYLIKVTSSTTKEKHELTGFITLLR